MDKAAGKEKFSAELENFSAEDLFEIISLAKKKHEEKIEESKNKLLAEIEEKANALGISIEEIARYIIRSKSSSEVSDYRGKASAKFRGPNGEEWSGRGRLLRWLQAIEAEGKNREDFKI